MTEDHTTVAEEVRKHIGEALSHNPTKNVYIYVIQDEETVLDYEDLGIYHTGSNGIVTNRNISRLYCYRRWQA